MALTPRLDKRCVFEKPTKTPSGGGGASITWSEQFSRWGTLDFAPLNATNEAIASGTIDSASRATITVREDVSTRTILTTWRVRVVEDGYRTALWNIREIQRPKRGWLRLIAETGVPT